MSDYNCIIITGTTASGKTKLATQLAYKINAEIISVDSRQVYRGLNIGAGKDLDEYIINDSQIPYHLIDVADINENFHLQKFINHFITAYNDIVARNKMPIICGGTGLYLDAILKQHTYAAVPVDENLREQLNHFSIDELLQKFNQYKNKLDFIVDTHAKKRLVRAIEIHEFLKYNVLPQTNFPNLKPIIFCIETDREERRRKISERLHHRLNNGMIEEVQQLIQSGISTDRLQFLGLEYNYITQYLLGKISYTDMQTKLETAIHQFAKRQMTWFRKMEREGQNIHWILADVSLYEVLEGYKKI